ncbi:hypothetical protein [Dulcicalothrix desertica]|uniref:hypothetical protein n=1 Tax=Dulcicalothrix desertica TaxID=32056 RepID=UPI0011998EFC|nr:hypothetical protein [Dulcicalothrix desertica]TWH62639.1 hypothetical protein CAL7102_00138 [Dulcicalothrix desertica PCC 7102]
MTNFKDYSGQKFGRLECLSFSARVEANTYWTCRCDCGQLVEVRIRYLVKGAISSCGCLKQQRKTTRKTRITKLKNFAGQRFGRLECIEPSELARVNGCTYWKCKCDCGNIVDKHIGNVVSGRIKSCGCLKSSFKDYIGQKFGHLECISPSKPAKGNYWRCKCDCGNIVDKNIGNVVAGRIKSCGCLNPSFKDYSGQKFGHLECISPSEPARVNGITYWKCKCDCGKIADFPIRSIRSGSIKSCGCLTQNSKSIIYYIKNPRLENQESLVLELKAKDEVGVLFYDNSNVSKAEIHVVSKVTLAFILLENGEKYNAKGKKIRAFGDNATYLCSIETAERLISLQ